MSFKTSDRDLVWRVLINFAIILKFIIFYVHSRILVFWLCRAWHCICSCKVWWIWVWQIFVFFWLHGQDGTIGLFFSTQWPANCGRITRLKPKIVGSTWFQVTISLLIWLGGLDVCHSHQGCHRDFWSWAVWFGLLILIASGGSVGISSHCFTDHNDY